MRSLNTLELNQVSGGKRTPPGYSGLVWETGKLLVLSVTYPFYKAGEFAFYTVPSMLFGPNPNA